MNVLTALQNSLKQPQGTPHSASPTFLSQRGNNAVDLVNEALRIRRSSRRDKVSFNENLKHKTEAFNVECRNKIEHEMGKKAEEFAVST